MQWKKEKGARAFIKLVIFYFELASCQEATSE